MLSAVALTGLILCPQRSEPLNLFGGASSLVQATESGRGTARVSAVIRAVGEFVSITPIPRSFIVTTKTHAKFLYVQISARDYGVRSFDDVRWTDVLRSYSFNAAGRLIAAESGPGKPGRICEIPSKDLPRLMNALWNRRSPKTWLDDDFDISFTLYSRQYGVMLSSLKRIVGSYQLYMFSKDLKQFSMINGY